MNEELGHTPGPWEVKIEPELCMPMAYNVHTIFGSGTLIAVMSNAKNETRDAALLAVAPEMLDVLKRLTASIDQDNLGSYHHDWHDALSVIAKAEATDE